MRVCDVPQLASQVHPVLNPDAAAAGLLSTVSQKQVWWQCPARPGHAWQATVATRVAVGGCPFCRGFRALPTDNLAVTAPDVAAQLDRERHPDVDPAGLPARTRRRFWWRCPADPAHTWAASVETRVEGGGCPYCAGRRRPPAGG